MLIYRNEPDHTGFSTNPQLQQEFSIFVPEIRSLFSTTYPQKMTGFKSIWWQHISSGYCLLIPSGNLTGLLWKITILKGKLSINGGRSRATLPGQPVTLMWIKNAWMKIQGEIRFFPNLIINPIDGQMLSSCQNLLATQCYPLVNMSMENHHFWWFNQLFLWPFSIAFC